MSLEGIESTAEPAKPLTHLFPACWWEVGRRVGVPLPSAPRDFCLLWRNWKLVKAETGRMLHFTLWVTGYLGLSQML